MVKVLYIYGGIDREELEKRVAQGVDPDTSFFGYIQVKKSHGIQADYLQIKKDLYKIAGGFIRKYLVLNTIYLLLTLYKTLTKYDVIVLTSSAYLNLLFLKKIGLFRKQRWIFLNLDLTILLKTAENKSLHKLILRATVDGADKIICVSKAQKAYLEESGFSPIKSVFIPLGVDNKFYKTLPDGEDFILTVGRDVGRDFKTLLEATKLVDEKVVIICSPKNLVGLLDLVPLNVTVLYDRPYSELRSYYERAKCFIISTKPDTYLVGSDCPGQTVILDSMAYGRAVIATYNSWFEGYFEERKHILTVPPEDSHALANAIREMTADDTLRKTLSIEGRKLIDAQCNSEVMGRKIVEVIKSV